MLLYKFVKEKQNLSITNDLGPIKKIAQETGYSEIELSIYHKMAEYYLSRKLFDECEEQTT